MALDYSTNIDTFAKNIHAMGVNGSFIGLIDSCDVRINGVQVLNPSPLSQIPAHFEVLASWGQDKLQQMGDTVDFYPDDDAINYSSILGEQNNSIVPALFVSTADTFTNKGLLRRQGVTSYDPTKNSAKSVFCKWVYFPSQF